MECALVCGPASPRAAATLHRSLPKPSPLFWVGTLFALFCFPFTVCLTSNVPSSVRGTFDLPRGVPDWSRGYSFFRNAFF